MSSPKTDEEWKKFEANCLLCIEQEKIERRLGEHTCMYWLEMALDEIKALRAERKANVG